MFSKRHKIPSWIVFILAVVFLSTGITFYRNFTADPAYSVTFTEATMATEITPTEAGVIMETAWPSEPPVESSTTVDDGYHPAVLETQYNPALAYLAYFLAFAGFAMGILYIFLNPYEAPILGPEGELALLALAFSFLPGFSYASITEQLVLCFTSGSFILVSLRGLWCWILKGCTPTWSLAHRVGYAISDGMSQPQRYILLHIVWCSVTSMIGVVLVSSGRLPVCGWGLLLITALTVCSIWKFGTSLAHLRTQLSNFSEGQRVTVQSGPFENLEQSLLTAQEKHEEAVRTAITSERFKVELISNVSHDLRTPLTSILGYSELLQKESLSPTGQEQLFRLNQKAGYMKELVESLFELTKVSSGVIECKKENIDLIRLLEQTIGLFDDQLTGAQLVVRRHYDSEAIPVITDGSRMHQVFANLLGNAIKYALPGTRIHLEARMNGGDCIVRMVNTASYEMDFQPNEILQRFVRGDKARSTKGSGLGLAIAQTYTESVGGSFHVAIDGDQFSAIVTLPRN